MKSRLILLLAWGALVGCLTPGPREDQDNNGPTHYSLRLGTTEKNTPPLPAYTPIFVDWHFPSGRIETDLAFKGWDFNGDGRFDLIESHGPDKSPGAQAFDFDFDGLPDSKRPISSKSKIEHKN